ncbi:DNA adenine methylase [Staphylococcus aureus]|uniref:DNA adenine methylase n=1 Tax=Staphylococcus TaxID=1279 RepID=UPI0005073C35|nr:MULTISPECIES: DNA adenine methylase [Staphylococcus]UVJ31354.1 DNA adenine methylase [Staphylococcus aureus]CDR23441.1 putative methylase [Staphylococcus argenteus]
MKNYNPLLQPILKWVGGKRQLLSEITPLIPKRISTYVEPFVGGGALLFNVQPKKAIINDLNEELINTYKVIKDSPEKLIQELKFHSSNNGEDYFYKIRSIDRELEYTNMNNVSKAARIIYLNKTCYNGLYRVNSSGFFNTPYGKYKSPNIVNETMIRAMSNYFNKANVKILNGDYKYALKGLRKGSFVYFDPPYVPISTSSSFTGYTEQGFDLDNQKELKEECDKLNSRGIKFLQSNSDTPFIRKLYSNYNIKTVQAKRTINSNAQKRGEINEVLIYNYEPGKL